MKQLTGWISVIMLMIFLFSCGKEKPLPTAYSDLFGDKEGEINDTLIVQQPGTETFFSRLINTGAGFSLLIGHFQNYHSVIYLKFDNLPDSVQVHSAKISLISNPGDSTLLASSQPFTANIFLADFEWENDLDPEQFIDQLPLMGQPYQTVTITPDTSNKFEFELDTLLVAQWADSTSGVTNYGIWLDSPDLDSMNSFYSAEMADASLVPRLELIYTDTDSTGTFLDSSTVYSSKDAFLLVNKEDDLNIDKNYFYAGKGLAFRSFVKFDLAGLDSTIHLNRATMEFVVNKENSIRNAAGTGDIIVLRLAGESWQKNDVDESPETSSYAGTLADSTLIFDVTPTIQGWIGNNYPNYGFLVRSVSENQSLARIAFYSSKSDPDLQPRLHLYYTLPPKQEF